MIDATVLCAELSTAVYGNFSHPRYGLTWSKKYDRDGAQAVLCGDGYRLFLAWRGTDEWSDWGADALYVKTDFFLGGRVHRGFYKHWLALWPDIEADIKLLDSRLPRYHTGHSLGGACAILSSAAIPPTKTIVFGCPRVGNRDFRFHS